MVSVSEIKKRNDRKVILEESEYSKKQKSLNYSIKEGSYASVSNGAGEQYIVPYALALNANNAQIGYLSSFVGIIGASSQLIGSKLMYKYSRKKLLVIFVTLQASMWFVLMALGILFFKGILTSLIAVTLLILFYSIYAIFGALVGPSWFSLMGDLTNEKERGIYFSKRNKINGVVAMIVALLASFFLDYMESLGWVILGFVTLFTIAAFGRFVSAWYFTKHYYPRTNFLKENYFSFSQFIKKAPGNNFGKFAIFIGLINLFTNFAGPFFAVYMLNELHFSYIWFTIVNISGTLFTIMFIPVWGRLGDKYGNRYLLKVTSFLIPLPPFLWLISGNPLFLIFVPQLVAGLGWSGFNLASSNFIYDAVTPERRGIVVSYYTMISGLAVFFGAIAGGLVAQYAHLSFMNIFLFIFLVSGIGRAIICLIFIPLIKEVKQIDSNLKKLSVFEYIYLFTPRPIFSMWRGVKSGLSEIMSMNGR